MLFMQTSNRAIKDVFVGGAGWNEQSYAEMPKMGEERRMNIPWWAEVTISALLVCVICRKAYNDGYHEGYMKAVRDTGVVINGICELKRIEREEK